MAEMPPLPDPCPAFLADPAPHRWTPIHLMQDTDARIVSARDGSRVIVVLEVCPSCHRWRHAFYTERGYVPRDADGVQSTT